MLPTSVKQRHRPHYYHRGMCTTSGRPRQERCPDYSKCTVMAPAALPASLFYRQSRTVGVYFTVVVFLPFLHQDGLSITGGGSQDTSPLG